MSKLVLDIDAGNFRTKIAGQFGVMSFSSAICEWFERDIEESFGEDDMEFKIDSRKGFAGSIAEFESTYGGEMMYGDSKAHDDTKIKVLLAIHRYIKTHNIKAHNVSIVVGQPIKQHKNSDKEFIKSMLLGYHEYEVNGHLQSIRIENVGVAAEGSSAFWSNPVDDKIHIIDAGGGTVNLATIISRNHVNTSSDTLNFGMESGKNKKAIESMARGIIRGTTRLQWEKNDSIYVCGGVAEIIAPLIKQHYPNTKVLQPIFTDNGQDTVVNSTYGNAVGFYNIAKGVFT